MAKSDKIESADIKKYMADNGLKADDLADMLGVSLNSVKRWIKGTPPSGTTAMILGVIIAGIVPLSTMLMSRNSKNYNGALKLYEKLNEIFKNVKH